MIKAAFCVLLDIHPMNVVGHAFYCKSKRKKNYVQIEKKNSEEIKNENIIKMGNQDFVDFYEKCVILLFV